VGGQVDPNSTVDDSLVWKIILKNITTRNRR